MNTEDSEFERIEREIKTRALPDPIHHTDPGETLEYITGWNDCRAAMLAEQPVLLANDLRGVNVKTVERFAELVRADEREACAQVCDDLPAPASCSSVEKSLWDVATLECGDAIRARSNT